MLIRCLAAFGVCAIVFAATTSARAEAGLCAGLGAGAVWLGPGQGRDASDIALAAGVFGWEGITPPGGRAVGLFTLGAAMPLRIEAAPLAPDGDPLIELFAADGRLVILDDDSGGGLSSRAEPMLDPGIYCVAVTGFGGASVAARLQVGRLEMPALTEGLAGGFAATAHLPPFVGVQPCLPATAAVRLGNGPIDADLAKGLSLANSAAQAPYYRFSLAAPQALSIRAASDAADPYIYLFDAGGMVMAENDDADSLDSRIDFLQPLAAGEYCIGVRALVDGDAPIRLTVTARGMADLAAEAYDRAEIAPPLDGSWPVTDLGRLDSRIDTTRQVPGDQAQWFVFDSPGAGIVHITADEITDSDPVLSVFEASGQWLADNDDANGSQNAELVLLVEEGRYLVAIGQFDPSYQGVIRLGLMRYVPALP